MRRLMSWVFVLLFLLPTGARCESSKKIKPLDQITKELYQNSLDLYLLGYVDESKAIAKISESLHRKQGVGSNMFDRLKK